MLEKILLRGFHVHVDGNQNICLTLLHSERPKLYRVLALLSAIGLSLAVLSAIKLRDKNEKDCSKILS